jgi:uncharacterized protein with WD repeat
MTNQKGMLQRNQMNFLLFNNIPKTVSNILIYHRSCIQKKVTSAIVPSMTLSRYSKTLLFSSFSVSSEDAYASMSCEAPSICEEPIFESRSYVSKIKILKYWDRVI